MTVAGPSFPFAQRALRKRVQLAGLAGNETRKLMHAPGKPSVGVVRRSRPFPSSGRVRYRRVPDPSAGGRGREWSADYYCRRGLKMADRSRTDREWGMVYEDC